LIFSYLEYNDCDSEAAVDFFSKKTLFFPKNHCGFRFFSYFCNVVANETENPGFLLTFLVNNKPQGRALKEEFQGSTMYSSLKLYNYGN